MIFHVINVLALSALIILTFDKIITVDLDRSYKLKDIFDTFFLIIAVIAASAFFYAIAYFVIKQLGG